MTPEWTEQGMEDDLQYWDDDDGGPDDYPERTGELWTGFFVVP